MKDKTVLITGANSGVGFATATALAKLGAAVIMVCRSKERGQVAQSDVAKVATGPEPVLMIADLSLQSAVWSLSEEVRARFAKLDVLVNNAGAIFARREFTIEGIEKTFAVNHLAPFLLTNLLIDRLRSTPGARIIIVAAQAHSGKLEFDNLQGERHYNFLGAYGRTKLCNILFSYELARRLEGTGITSNCMCPGPTRTRFGDDMRGPAAMFPAIMKRIPFLFVGPEKGAQTTVMLASSPEFDRVSGRFHIGGRERRTKLVTYDRNVAARLWQVSQALIKPEYSTACEARARMVALSASAEALARSR